MQCVRPRAKDGGGLTWFATFLKKKKRRKQMKARDGRMNKYSRPHTKTLHKTSSASNGFVSS